MSQVALTVALVELPQTSFATADKISETEQTSNGTALVSVMVKANPCPGCNPGAAKLKLVTMSLPKTRLVSTMFVRPTFPKLVAVAVTTSGSPGRGSGLVGQVLVSARPGVVSTGQVALALVVMRLLQRSRAVAVKVFGIEHTLNGTGSVPLNAAPWPGFNLGMVITGVLFAG